MERLNGIREYQIGERFTVVDLNPVSIPRTDSKVPIMAQLQPKAMRSVVTKIDPDVDIITVEDQTQWVMWQRVLLRAETNPYKKGSSYVMNTKRRVFDGVYTNRSGVYLFVHESADHESFRTLLHTIVASNPRLGGEELFGFIRDQLLASQLKVLFTSGG